MGGVTKFARKIADDWFGMNPDTSARDSAAAASAAADAERAKTSSLMDQQAALQKKQADDLAKSDADLTAAEKARTLLRRQGKGGQLTFADTGVAGVGGSAGGLSSYLGSTKLGGGQ